MGRLLLSLAFLTLAPTLLHAAELPTAGSCERNIVVSPTLTITTQVTWDGESASVITPTQKFPGQVRALRKLDDGFKINIIYYDAVYGESEAVIFHRPLEGRPTYRMATVSFTEHAGKRLIETVFGFEDVNCIVIY